MSGIQDILSSERMSEGVHSDSEMDNASTNSSAPSFDDFHRWQAHIALKNFGEGLHAAAQAIFPDQSRPQYSKVYVLMLCWEDADPHKPIPTDMSRLFDVFDNIYHFETEIWRIPNENCHVEANQRILDFMRLGGDSPDDLKIVFYSGQARLNKNKKLAWTSGRQNSKSKYPDVQWSGIQTALEQSQSDVLALLDCCHAGTAYNDEGNGTTELIAACAYNSATNGVPSYSLAKELAAELRELSTIPSFSIGNLYDNIFSRVRGQMTEEGLEHQSPVYLSLTQENPKSPRSIRLAVHKQGWEPTMPNRLASDDVHSPQSDAFGITGTNGDHNDLAFKRSSAASVGPTPRMAFAIRLTEDFRVGDLSQNLFSEWLRNIPPSVQEVKIEAGFHSYSSLLVISVPVCMSIYMPKDPAVISLGPITSFNQVLTRVPIPKDLPTPNPDTWTTWGNPGNGISGLDAGANAHEIVTGVNGDGNSKLSELRFRKNAHLIPPKAAKATRPTLDKAYSSQYSAASNLTESPAETNGINGVYPTTSVPETPETPHPTHTHSYQGRKGHHQHHSSTDYIDDPDLKEYPRISKPVELLRSSYDCVVIGSGYGGAVAASRMARAGQRVCLLERGKERWPGEYPVGFLEAMKQFHVSGEFAPGFLKGAMVEGGDPTGLYHLIVGKGQNAFVGNGLGGTSLLNANVYLEADDATMKMDCWPEELQGHDKLKKYYKRAAKVLEPQPYPKDFPELKKLNVLEKQAKALGMHEKFYRVPQTTKFQAGPNSCGVQMQSSTGTGQDATGVNDGSKSSTLVNYLSDAWNWGAEMFCECEVRYIKKHPTEEGYLIFFAWHGSKRGAFKTNLYEDLMWVHAREYVFLGAGAIGTTEILLRSKKLGLSMSDKVGKGMSGNGDILAFGYNTDEEVNAIGKEYTDYNPTGPTITGVIDCRDDQENPIDGYVIEEGAVPKALAPLFQTMLELMPGNQIPKGEGLFSKVKHAFAQQGSRFLGPYFKKGSIERTQVYLIMSHDSNQAIMTMKDDKPILEFLGVGRSKHVEWLNDLLRQATEAVGGHFVQSPFYACLGQQEITVHPIGGACMSKDGRADNGVTNHYGELLNGTADEIHEGLVVTDASVIPTALGVNPFATITALAERSVEHAALRIGRRIDFKTKNDILDFRKEPHQYAEDMRQLDRQDTIRIAEARELVNETQASKAKGFGFSEVMSGYIHIDGEDEVLGDKLEDYETAAKTARGLCEEARFFLSVQAWDTDITVNRADHKAMLTGTFTCGSLPGSPFMVQRGNFHLFSLDTSAPGTRNLKYEFDMTSVDGTQFHFSGHKVVDSSVALGPWRFWTAASTLYVTISHATGDRKILGRGMMHIKPSDFLSEIFTLKPSGRNFLAKVQSTANFMSFFVRQSASLFLAPFVYQQYPAVAYNGYMNDTSPDNTINIEVEGVQTLLHVFEPRNPKIKTKNLFMIPGASVDEQIFSLNTIHVNAINYFTRAGYRVFVTVHRICLLQVAKHNWTTFEARLDIKACLVWIRENYGKEKIYCISHCMGAVAFSCGLLDGTIPTSWIKGISTSQVFCHPIWATLNMAKVLAGPIPFDKLYSMFGGQWFSCKSSTEDSYFQQLVNQILRFYPDSRQEICNNTSCHRCSLIFGRLWNHRNLNEYTHRQIDRFFGGVNMTLLHTLMQMGHRGCVTGPAPLFHDLTHPSNFRRLEGIPIMLFSGSDNQVLTPESTDKTYETLRTTFGTKDYERNVVQGYGHLDCWMGREAYKDVFPMVRDHIDRVTREKGYKYQEPDWKNDWECWKDLPQSGNPENEG